MPSLHSALDALTEASPSSSLLWSTTAADRFSAARTLVAALHAAPPTAITPLLPSLTDVLRPPLLDAAHAGCFAACADAAVAVATRCGDGALPLVDALVPLLIDQAGCASTASAVGAHAHGAVAAILPHVPAHDALPALLAALYSPTPAGRRRLADLTLLALLCGADHAGSVLRGRRAPALAAALGRLLHDGHATTRRLARHALLALMEHAPRAATEPFGRLPLRTQRHLAQAAKHRASVLGPSLLPPPPAHHPHPQAAMLQAALRGALARRAARRHAAFVTALAIGDRLRVAGHAGTLRFRGKCAFAPGTWLGVELDRPVGKHDGAFKGERFFRCAPRHGLFVRPVSAEPHDPPPPQPRAPKPKAAALAAPAPLPAPAVAEGAAPEAAPATPTAATPMTIALLLESHRAALTNLRDLCEGALTMVRSHELASRVQGESVRGPYLQRMSMLAMQSKLLAMQLSDAITGELDGQGPMTPTATPRKI